MKKLLFLIVLFFINISFLYSQKASTTSGIIEGQKLSQLKKDLVNITNTPKPRNYKNVSILNNVANYIKAELKKVCDSVAFQEYDVNGEVYKNVIGSLGIKNKERLIIGAHYDVFGNSNGADDNASGVTGLLKLARLLSREDLPFRIDFVAYALEEPPFFRTKKMGSYIHAKYLSDIKVPVKGMICLESIGYFNEEENSQKYPVKKMELYYGKKGDFITIVTNKESAFSTSIIESMTKEQKIKTHVFKGSPQNITGVDFSDHLNYWKFNYNAIMITNTAFYRNNNYHKKSDKIETLDLKKMGSVIHQLYKAIKKME